MTEEARCGLLSYSVLWCRRSRSNRQHERRRTALSVFDSTLRRATDRPEHRPSAGPVARLQVRAARDRSVPPRQRKLYATTSSAILSSVQYEGAVPGTAGAGRAADREITDFASPCALAATRPFCSPC